jgi:hypothetical protein
MMPVIAMPDLDLRDQRVPMRLDLNVPPADGVSIVLSGRDLAWIIHEPTAADADLPISAALR